MSCFVLCSDLTDAWSKKPGTGDELLRSIKGRCILCSHLFIHLRRARHLAAVTPLDRGPFRHGGAACVSQDS